MLKRRFYFVLFCMEALNGATDLSRIKAGLYFGSTVLVKTLAGLLVIKVLAWKLGPEGFGLLGQLMTLVAIVGMLAGGGITNGLIKVLAKAPLGGAEGKVWYASAFTLSALVSGAVAVLLFALSSTLSSYFLPGVGALLFTVLAVSQVVIAYGNLPLAEASSRGDSRTFSLITVAGTLVGAGLVIMAVWYRGFIGATYAVVLMPAMVGLCAVFYAVVSRRVLLQACRWSFERGRMKLLMSFSMVTLIGALSVPLAQLYMRDALGASQGWEQVGQWQGVIKLSDVYMQFMGVVLINFVLPRIAAAADKRQVFKEWLGSVSALVVVLLSGFAVFYFLRNFLIILVFSSDFLPMTQLLVPQMAGDVLRTIAASISYLFMARGIVRVSFVFELLQGVVLVCAFSMLFDNTGVMAPVYAHLFTYLSLTIVMAFGLLIWMKRKPS
ncbi:O-antigen translocase [Pseudomonas sp. NPDC089407]|uniref:O-antigen translocase n=1 Tax=Pseudomonas sp. NPDC089407 TaxID=3364464 RepID=UPI0038503B6E